MQFQITDDELFQYMTALSIEMNDKEVPGNLVMHKVITMLNVPQVLSHQATFKHSIERHERLNLDLFQANNVIEYKVTSGRQLKLAGTIQLK
ncbi:hypothetical protein ROU88_06300 [Macrococcus capreoli]|uniref:hypothetical protein n=1 Tax=Macrococcus capreoli TaxID=2982690 RepID=UPI0021D5FD0F|nr:hypothetical protein [Macrococcus sp. TMW 2.2395]MCU7556964.1 hypothetical protein [Macrococcus sp. TMW 2.2395]